MPGVTDADNQGPWGESICNIPLGIVAPQRAPGVTKRGLSSDRGLYCSTTRRFGKQLIEENAGSLPAEGDDTDEKSPSIIRFIAMLALPYVTQKGSACLSVAGSERSRPRRTSGSYGLGARNSIGAQRTVT
jgi:hypothetical protein